MDEQEHNLSDTIELSFVPSWARKPPEENPYQDQDFSGGRSGDRSGRERRSPRQGPDRRRTERDDRRPRSGP
ncbi:MAG: hypothetical protein K9N49_04030, partial [Candidatus Marinimicrobia bacterium]|nr:hypothetical protein [Candidatus Neomarinimicrobiota bacterium]